MPQPEYAGRYDVLVKIKTQNVTRTRKSIEKFSGTPEDERIIREVISELMADPAEYKRRYHS
jgi:hypothetical protein